MHARPPQAADAAALAPLWNAKVADPTSCWANIPTTTVGRLQATLAVKGRAVSDRASQARGALFVWDEAGEMRISILAENDTDFDDMLQKALTDAEAAGIDRVYGHVPLTATDTRRQLAKWNATYENRGLVVPNTSTPVLVFAVVTVSVTLKAMRATR